MNVRFQLSRAAHRITWFLGTRCPKSIPLVFVVGYPRSGTTWVCQLVADCLQLPFPRNMVLPVGFPAVVHGHELVWKSYPKGVYVMRDGRDAEVSMYFYASRRIGGGRDRRLSGRVRQRFDGMADIVDVRSNLAAFIEQQRNKPIACRHGWGEHVRSYSTASNPNMVLLKFEDLVQDGEQALSRVVAQLAGKEADPAAVRDALRRFSLDRQKQFVGERGQSDQHHMRKGQTGDWRRYFTREAAQVFDRHWGEVLIKAGYEKDHSWVEACGEGD